MRFHVGYDKIVNFFEIISSENSARPKSQLSMCWTSRWNFGQTGEQKIKANKKRLTIKKERKRRKRNRKERKENGEKIWFGVGSLERAVRTMIIKSN